MPKGGYPIFHYLPQPEQSSWRVCLRSPWQDFLAAGVARVMEEFGVDGVYLDGTEYPFGCCNTEHGCGALWPDGSITPTYPIFGVRNAMRRIYSVVRSRKRDGQVNIHNSTCMTIPTLEWGTSYWDGEQFGSIAKSVDIGELLPLDAFRAEFMGRQWGVPAEFLCYGKPFTYEEAWSFCLLHDVPVRPNQPGVELELISSIWKVMDDFGRSEAEWLPYWRNAEYVKTSPAGAYVSLYRHPKHGVLAVVSNLNQKEASVVVKLKLAKLGLRPADTIAHDTLAHEDLQMANGRLKLKLASFEWRLIWLRPVED